MIVCRILISESIVLCCVLLLLFLSAEIVSGSIAHSILPALDEWSAALSLASEWSMEIVLRNIYRNFGCLDRILWIILYSNSLQWFASHSCRVRNLRMMLVRRRRRGRNLLLSLHFLRLVSSNRRWIVRDLGCKDPLGFFGGDGKLFGGGVRYHCSISVCSWFMYETIHLTD